MWLLKRSLYGLRAAPSLWAQHLSDTLQGVRFYQSKLDPGVYVRHYKNTEDFVMGVVHVDDTIFTGKHELIVGVLQELTAKYELQHENWLLHPGGMVNLVGKNVLKTAGGYAIIKSPTYAQDIAQLVGLDLKNSKTVNTPDVPPAEAGDTASSALEPERAAKVRAAVGKLMWISADRPNLRYTTGRLSTQCAAPTEATWNELKRVARYLLAHPVGISNIAAKKGHNSIDSYIPCSPSMPPSRCNGRC